MAQPPFPDPKNVQPADSFAPEEPVPASRPPRGWWGRNWFWVVPVGCLAPLLCCCGGTLLIGVGAMAGFKATEPYKEAVARAQQSPEVQAALGTPIQVGFLVQGNIKVENDHGEADLTIPLSGPKGSGTLHVVGTKAAGKWTYTTMVVDVPGSGTHIDLTGTEKGP
jgi:hypothetical protein